MAQVSKKPKHRAHQPATPADLRARVERALREQRTQQALELSHQLIKQDPSPPSQELLRRAQLARARHLRAQGYTRDALTVLESAVQSGGPPEFLQQLAEELAQCGDARKALAVLQRISGAALSPATLGPAADAALRHGPAGRDLLPQPYAAQFDLILKAFAHAEAGQDEEARTALQGIGLQSPFLEWKLLLRGLLAYYQNDNARALENWQRLNADRLPARLAAPLRFTIDEAFRTAQPPATQLVLQKQADQLQSSTLVQGLRGIQAALAGRKQLGQAFRQAETLLPTLRRHDARLVPRLAACFYWAIIDHGLPEDMRRYRHVFGAPADDPQMRRLEALALERRDELHEAHKYWQKFEQEVAANPAAWPGEQAKRVRALVWRHMGTNADAVDDDRDSPGPPPFFDDRDRLRPLAPSAEECYRKAIELAPDQLEPYEALLKHFQHRDKAGRAEQAARKLLKQFPEHVPTLETLGDLRMEKQDYAEALGFYQRALRGNPLERRLRSKVSTAHTYNARAHAEAGRFDAARAEYQSALAFDERRRDTSVLCKWAACEFKAGQPERAEELLQQALAEAGSRPAIAFSMLIEVIRLKLPKPLKVRFEKEWTEALQEPPTGAAAAEVADTAAMHRLAGVKYVGQKTHEKKVTTYLDRALKAEFTEDQLERVCGALQAFKSVRLLLKYLRLGQQRFPASPFFFVAEAEYQLSLGRYRCNPIETGRLLAKARELAKALPRDDRQQQLLEVIQEHEQTLRSFNPYAGLFGGGLFNPMMGPMFDDEDDYEDDGY
jgi:tetratricopeptide (TPR) repeat protein